MPATRMMRAGAVAAMLMIAACAAPPPKLVVAPTPVPPPAPVPRPYPPNSAAPNLIIPLTDLAGRRMTPNVDLSPEQALWQMRIGLNVAALNCRGPFEATLVSNYSTFLKNNQAVLVRAERWVITNEGRRAGTSGIAARDALSTRLFNYFAQPPVTTAFCAQATSLMALAAVEPRATVQAWAATNLPLLDQPFVNFYNDYAAYQRRYGEWLALQPAPAVQPAAAAVAPPAPVPQPPR